MLDAENNVFYAFIFIGGIFSALVGIAVSGLSLKFLIATLLGLILITGLLLFSDIRKELLLFGIVFFVPVNIDINLFLHKHVGTASSVAISATWLLSIALLLFFILERLNGHRSFRVGGEVIALLCYLLWGILTLINAKYPVYVSFEIIRLIMLGTVLFTISNIANPRLLRFLIICILVTLLFQSLLACVQYFMKSFPQIGFLGVVKTAELFPGQKVHRVMGTLGHPNFLGYFLEITLPVAFAVFWIWPSWAVGILAIGAWLIGSVALIFTKSRGAWMSYPFGVAFVVLFLISKRLLSLKSLFQLLLIFLLALALLFFSYPMVKKRFLGRDYQALAVRMPLNKAAFSVFKQFPVLGVGLNNFSEVFKEYDKTGFSRIFRGYKHVVHNMYLLIATETGVVGLTLFLLIFSFPFFYMLKGFVSGIDDFMLSVMIGICGGILAHFIHVLVDPGFIMTPHISALMFLLLGWCSATYGLYTTGTGNS